MQLLHAEHTNVARDRSLSSRKVGTGFTLLELLVATAVFVLLLIVLMQTLGQSSQLWVATKRQSEHALNCRAIGDFIGEELKKALPPLDRTATNSLQFIINPSSVSTNFLNRDAAFWQAPIASEKTGGDIAEIGYFVKWDTSKPGNPRAMLCRFFAPPIQNGVTNANYLIHSDPSNWINDAVLQAVAPADSTSDYRGLFAENVLGLWLSPLDSAGGPLTAAFDSRKNSYQEVSGLGTNQVTRSLPRWMEVSLLTLDSSSAARVTPAIQSKVMSLVSGASNASICRDGMLQSADLGAISPGLRVYTTRILLQNSQ